MCVCDSVTACRSPRPCVARGCSGCRQIPLPGPPCPHPGRRARSRDAEVPGAQERLPGRAPPPPPGLGWADAGLSHFLPGPPPPPPVSSPRRGAADCLVPERPSGILGHRGRQLFGASALDEVQRRRQCTRHAQHTAPRFPPICAPKIPRMGATGARLLWSCLLLLLALLHKSGSQDLTCMVSPRNVNWTQTFNDICLNFSGLGLSRLRTQPLQASRVQVLDLSRNGLQALPGVFFASLGKLQTLIVTHNPLAIVDRSLALRCDLELRADCSCGLASWHDIRRNNCSGEQELLCLPPDTGALRNLSIFLRVSCPSSLAPGVIGALVAGTVFLIVAVSGSVLAWRLRRHQGTSSQGFSKDQRSYNVPRQVTDFQPRHISETLDPKAPDTSPGGSMLDYENIFIDALDEDCSWTAPRSSSGDTDFYMNYNGAGLDPQPVYCNLETLGRAPA
ncbi:leucine-rich repeat-containing protein 25 isoform X2 [Mesocricetus auratus]|uniref:Leucine-rich repeat-containing protein 25 isoform X2 n=1 Tax=Mesocricetus auratus TaxID=10036 RepID=A0ABM2X564_MESAU|nr:leucine-rich repeat-containing protein 25 isoform X2 [Mesocricetus auratus]